MGQEWEKGTEMTKTRYRGLDLAFDAGVATLTINRPDAGNAIDTETHESLERVWPDLARQKDVRAIVLTGAGRTFSTGGDIKTMAARAGSDDGWNHLLGIGHAAKRLMVGMLEVPQPIVAAVNGHATGLGATLALAADVSVISDAAKFGDTHVNVGLVAGDGGAIFWPLLIGPNRAKELLMRATLLRGGEAHALGLINHVAPAEQVLPMAQAIAAELAAKPPLAVQWTKMTVNRGIRAQLEAVLEAGLAWEMLSMQSRDHGEAAKAIVEGREPRFEGR
ncbi:enoyl-CoA hydratase/isomerase family protein [Sphingosinicella ginsenosidimutans]